MEKTESKGIGLFFFIFILVVVIGLGVFIWSKNQNQNSESATSHKPDSSVIDKEGKFVKSQSLSGESKGPLK